VKKLSFFFFLLLLTSPSFAAPTFDATATATGVGVSTLSVNLTVGGGCTNPIVIADIPWSMSGIGSITALTIGGSVGTFINGVSPGSAAIDRRIEMWRRVGVSIGSNSVQADMSATAAYISVSARSYCGVDQATPTGTSATADNNGNNAIATVDVTSASGELVVDSVMTAGATAALTVGAGQTQRVNDATHAGIFLFGSSDEAGAGTTTMSWTTDTDDYTGIVAVPLKPAAAGATVRRKVIVIQ